MIIRFAAAAVALALVAGCETTSSSTSAGNDNFAERSQTVSITGTVESVDLATRMFTVSDGGTSVTFRAGSQVQNLGQLEVGDKIQMDYHESVAVGMAHPADKGDDIGELAMGRNEPGMTPGGGAVESSTGVVEFLSYDPSTKVARIKRHDGTIQSAVVQPEMRDFAAARSPGDRLVVAIDRAVAVNVVEVN